MRKIQLFVLMLAATLAAQAQVTLYAYRNTQLDDVQNAKKGPVKFSPSDPSDVTLIADQTRFGCVYAGAYYNYKWYAQVTKPGTQSSLEGFYTIDMNDGTRTLISTAGDHLSEMAYDYSTDTMYGIKTGTEKLMTIDLETGETAEVGPFTADGSPQREQLYMLALAVDKNGTMYGIDINDYLYRIDKATGDCTAVGPTGVNAAYTQSMDFDRNTGTLYWANNGDYVLYSVDTKTGKAIEIGPIGATGYDSLSSLFVPYVDAPEGAPDRVTNRKASANGNTVTVSWTNPSIDAQGNPLTELTAVKVYRDGSLIKTIDMAAGQIGQAASFVDENVATGSHSYKLIPVNSKGEGGVDTDNVETYVGENAPGAVGNFKVEQGDNAAILSWSAPQEGMFGGEFDPSSITGYVITRATGSSSTTINIDNPSATTYTDSPGFGTYTYSIYAVNEVGNGIETSAPAILVKPENWIIMTTGEAIVETGKTYKFYDIGGPNGSYSNSMNDTLVIRPKNPNAAINVAFTQFDTDTYGDFLYIFDGADVKAPLIGEYTANAVPSDLISLQSTSTDGALTFVFASDVMAAYAGWSADVTAVEKLQRDLAIESFSGEMYPPVGTESAYEVVVRNKGLDEISDYSVRLLDAQGNTLDEAAGTAVTSMQTASITLKFTPAAAGDMEVHAEIVCSDDDAENNVSKSLAISVLEEGSRFIEVGDNNETILVTPASFASTESISETIYYADEIGLESGTLEMLSYTFMQTGSNYSGVSVKIYMGETELDDLTAGAIPANELTLVYDGTCSVNQGDTEWVFPLTTPYAYKGGNLVVMVYKLDPSGVTSYDIYYKGTYGDYANDPKRSRYASVFFEGETIDPNDPEMGYSAQTSWADIRLLFTDAKAGVETIKNGSSVKVWPNPVANTLYIAGDIEQADLYNSAGVKVLSSKKENAIDVSACPAGIYFLKATTADGIVTVEKIMKR